MQATGDNEKVVINSDRQSTITDIYSSINSSIKAEIIWTLKCVMGSCSGCFSDDIDERFLAMFPDLKSVLNNFSLARTKPSYVINHGLAPYFKNQHKTALQKSKVYVYSFDESLNSVTQTSEMNLYIRYWDKTEIAVKVRYYGSSFLGHGRHSDILNHFMSLTRSLKSEALYQVSMDEPNVNLKFFKEFAASFKEDNFHSLVDIGSCSLHIVHGAFKTGAEKSEWGLKKFLKAAYIILHDSPACREDYESYPLNFCATQ